MLYLWVRTRHHPHLKRKWYKCNHNAYVFKPVLYIFNVLVETTATHLWMIPLKSETFLLSYFYSCPQNVHSLSVRFLLLHFIILHYTILLVPFCYHLHKLCFVFVSCVQRRVVEGSGVGSGGCVVHIDVHREWVMLWVAAMWLLYWAWPSCLDYMQKLWTMLGLYGMLEFKLCCEILLLLNMADI